MNTQSLPRKILKKFRGLGGKAEQAASPRVRFERSWQRVGRVRFRRSQGGVQ